VRITNMKTLPEKIAVMQAAERGEKVQFLSHCGAWIDCDYPEWDWKTHDYRVADKPAPVIVAPDGFELVDANSKEIPQIGWMFIYPNNVMSTWTEINSPHDKSCVHYWNNVKARFAKPITNPPPVPEGYELVAADSDEIPKVSWMVWDREKFCVWSPMFDDHDESCRHLNRYAGARYCRPIVKRTPKMPDAPFFWIRPVCNREMVWIPVGIHHDVVEIPHGGRLTLPDLYNLWEWSPDRKIWYNFFGDKVAWD